MAIQFNCPYCTAAIRVADKFSGKQGSCPKCSTKLLVPDIAPPPSASAAPPPAIAPVPPMPEPPLPPSAPEAAPSTPPSGLPDFAIPPTADDAPDFVPPPSAPVVSRHLRRKSRRQKSQRVYAVAIPVACFCLFFAIVALVTFTRTPELKGTLRGTLALQMEIPSTEVPLADLGLTSDGEAEAALAFETDPESFVSPQMTCRISLDGSKLVVDVTAGPGFSWFAVNPRTDMTLAAWIRDNTDSLNEQRLQQIAATGQALCKDKILKASGTSVVFDAENYRDGFGLNSHVGAFGFAIEAVAKNHRSPCVHEDANGTLYFALPDDTSEFRLRTRTINGSKLFPGEGYTVQVARDEPTAAPPAAPDQTTEDLEPSDGDLMNAKPSDDVPLPAEAKMSDPE